MRRLKPVTWEAVRQGFAVEAPPGAPVTLALDETRVDPFSPRQRLASDPGESS